MTTEPTELNTPSSPVEDPTCTRRTVWATLYDAAGRERLTARNGLNPSRGSCLEGDCPRGRLTYETLPPDSPYGAGEGLCLSPHAEMRVLAIAGRLTSRGGRLDVSEEPCHQCKVVIEDSDLAKVTWPGGEWLAGDLFPMSV